MPELTLTLYVFVAVATVYCGVYVYRRWINHITIYGIMWGLQIILFQIRLIKYPDLSLETTLFIFGAWVVFVLASLTFRTFYSGQERLTQDNQIATGNLITAFFSLLRWLER